MDIKPGISFAKTAIAFTLLCAVFSFSAMAQSGPEAPLDAEAAAALVQELTDGLPGIIEEEAEVTAITAKWEARQDLAGKTKAEILKILFADLRSVVKEKEKQDSIWKSWVNEESSVDERQVETPVETLQKPAAPPVNTPAKPVYERKNTPPQNSNTTSASTWDDCPPFPSALAGVLYWEALRLPDMLLCRALMTDSGAEAFAMTISRESPFRPRRSDRAESFRLHGRELLWYRGKLPDQPNVEVREILIQIAEERVVHVIIRANDARTVSKYQGYVTSLPFPDYVE